MIHLSSTSEILKVEVAAAGSIDYTASYTDSTASDVAGGSSQGNIATATTAVVLAAPAASTTRIVKAVTLCNRGTDTNFIRIKKDVSGTEYHLTGLIALQAGEFLRLDNDGLVVYDITGRPKSVHDDLAITTPREIWKVGTAAEAAGQFYCFSKDSGAPGAWAVGTPGVNGRNTDGTSVADAGCTGFANPSSGGTFLSDANFACTSAAQILIHDFLWVNSGLNVTLNTAQAITQPTLPARDNNGSSNGEGVNLGLLVTTATTNGAAIANITVSYTNSAGVAGRTATMANYPATAVLGTFVKFQLQAGDIGVRSVQSITFGTQLVAGAVSLVAFRQVFSQSCTVANAGGGQIQVNREIQLFNGSCLLLLQMSTGTAAVNISGTIYLKNK